MSQNLDRQLDDRTVLSVIEPSSRKEGRIEALKGRKSPSLRILVKAVFTHIERKEKSDVACRERDRSELNY